MAKDMVSSRYATEQQKNVKLDKAYGKKASALNARPATEAGNPENEGEFSSGGHMFANRKADRSNDRKRGK